MYENTYTLEAVSTVPPSTRWFAWISKGVIAILDQGLISGSNFAVSILLARWLSADQYGAYALAFSTFILLTLVYTALILEPMSVFGGSAYRLTPSEYVGALIWIHGAISLVILGVLGSASLVLHLVGLGGSLPTALAAAGLAGPCVLLLWLGRRAHYLGLAPLPAAAGALLYCVVIIAGLFVLYRWKALSAAAAFLLMGIGALATGSVLLVQLRPNLRCKREYLRRVWEQHWIYGRWALASSVATWIPSNIFFIFMTGASGMAMTGQLRALLNFALPVGQVATALSLLFQPFTSRVLQDEGIRSLKKVSTRIKNLYLGGALFYWTTIVLTRHQLVHLLYGDKYRTVVYLLPLLAISSVLQCSVNGPAIGLRAMEEPRLVFWAYVVAAGISLAVGLPATLWFGLWGVLMCMTISYLAAFSVAQWLLSNSACERKSEVSA